MNLPPPVTPTRPSSSVTTFSFSSRQHRQLALTRVRVNVGVLVFIAFMWYFSVWDWVRSITLAFGGAWAWTILKIILLCLPTFNILEATYALNMPPPAPVATPPRATLFPTPSTNDRVSTPAQRRLRGMPSSLPKVASLPSTPVRGATSRSQIGPSPNASFNSSFGTGDLSFSTSPASSSFSSTNHINSSPLAAYMGRHSPRVGRPLNGQSLHRLLPHSES